MQLRANIKRKETKELSFRVLKFGGTSVATTALIQDISKIIKRYCEKNIAPIVVLSAMGDTTDLFYAQALQVSPQPDARSLDQLMACGEQISVALMAIALIQEKISAVCLTAAQAGIEVEGDYGNAIIKSIDVKKIKRHFQEGRQACIITGYQGVGKKQETYTLGRGGSDTSAVALAAALQCPICEIYTDVDGIYSADPNRISEAILLPTIDYQEMIEYARLGAGVLHSRCIAIAAKNNVKIHVRSSKHRRDGTLVCDRSIKNAKLATTKAQKNHNSVVAKKSHYNIEGSLVTGLALRTDESQLTVHDIPDRIGLAAEMFTALTKANINVDLIIQTTGSNKRNSISITVHRSIFAASTKVLQRFVAKHQGSLDVAKKIAVVSVIGIGMNSHSGIAAKVFAALGKNKINIEMISTSEIKISVVIDHRLGQKALEVVRDTLQNLVDFDS